MTISDMYQALLKMRDEMPKPIGPRLIVCHPGDLQGIIDSATANGYIVVPFDESTDGWRFRAVYVSEAFGHKIVVEDFIMVSERGTPGEIATIDLQKHWIAGLSDLR